MNIGDKIKIRRKELGISAEELGEKIGRNRATIYRYENGDISNLSLEIAENLANSLNFSLDELIDKETILFQNNNKIEHYKNILANNIKKRRLALNMSQEELAQKAGYSSKSSINKIELGKNDIPFSKFVDIATALDTTVTALTGWTTAHPNENTFDKANIKTNTDIFAENLDYYMSLHKKTRNDLSKDLNISYYTITDWTKAKKYPRIDKIELLAEYFGISKADLIENKNNIPNTLTESAEKLARKMNSEKHAAELLEKISSLNYEQIKVV